MSDAKKDAIDREVGAKSAMAIDALALAVWDESKKIVARAHEEHDAGELTAERSQTLLIALLETNRIYEKLENRVEEGIRAGRRIAKTFEIEAEKAREPTRIGNRFARSRVDSPPEAS